MKCVVFFSGGWMQLDDAQIANPGAALQLKAVRITALRNALAALPGPPPEIEVVIEQVETQLAGLHPSRRRVEITVARVRAIINYVRRGA